MCWRTTTGWASTHAGSGLRRSPPTGSCRRLLMSLPGIGRRYELRWLRTIRSVQPRSYMDSSASATVPVALLGTLLAGADSVVLGVL